MRILLIYLQKVMKITAIKGNNLFLNEVGYKNFGDLYHSLFNFKYPLFGIVLATVLTSVSTFIDSYIYSPYQGITVLLGVTLLDSILGISKAVYLKEGVDPARMMRGWIRLVFQIMFVGLAFQMSMVWTFIVTKWIVDALLILFTLSTFWSALRNAYLLEIITKEQYTILESIIGLKNIFRKFRKKE